jgi:hypothetical protein
MTSMLFLTADVGLWSPKDISLIAGVAFIIIGLVGGGIELRELKLPQMPAIPRMACLLIGCVLTGLVLFHPSTFEYETSPGQEAKRELGSAIPRLLDVTDVKKILTQLGYFHGSVKSNEPDDDYFQAVVNFQRSKGITQDALVGGETYAKLREAAPWYFGDGGQKTVDAKPTGK